MFLPPISFVKIPGQSIVSQEFLVLETFHGIDDSLVFVNYLASRRRSAG